MLFILESYSRLMRTSTAVLVVALFVLLVGGGFYAFAETSGSGTLSERWVSDTSRNYQQNHHPMMATELENETIIVAPINELSTIEGVTDTSCALVWLDPSNGDAERQAGLPAENCTNHALTEPAIDDIDGDGTPEVLSATGDQRLVAHDADTGAERWRHPTTSLGYSKPATANLLPGDGKEVVVVDLQGGLFVVRSNGTTAWDRNHDSSTWADPQIADFDGDGDPEIAVGTGDAIYLYEADGELLWEKDISAQFLVTGQADDGKAPELFVASNDDVVALDGDDGGTIWSRSLDTISKMHSVGDGDGDGTDEVYLGLSGGTVQALDASDGTDEWSTQFPGENRIMPPPTLGDIGGDRSPELVVGTQEGVVYVLDPSSGEQLATYERETPIWTYPVLADIDEDPGSEILIMYGDGRVAALSFEG
ncbi:hypothetical protein BRC88_07085 [Halobacteriales archaeon QS_4_69_225]|nr:MAG: hypothetical protein BRC88_07085 [Halobacteriales archaeon QS_4_69_225]